jgi:glycosyltransferase involved in cell wall biosynthesis
MRGTPAVAFAEAGGVSESIVDGQTGYLVAEGDDPASELAAALGLLLQDADTRTHMGERASKYASSFTWARTVDTVAGVVDAARSRRLLARGPVGQRLP